MAAELSGCKDNKKKIKYRKKKSKKNKTLNILPVEFRGILLAKQQNLLIS